MASLPKKCAFTSGESVGSGEKSTDCTQRSGENVMIACPFCRPEPTRLTYRCSCCYAKFASSIKGRLRQLEIHHNGKCVREPAIDALLEIDWRARADDDGGYQHDALQYVQPGVFQWRIPCPSCYDFEVGAVDPMAPTDFSEREPPIVGDEILELRAPSTDHVTGLVKDAQRVVSLRVLSVDSALSREEELRMFFRAADPPVHDKYRVLWQPHDAEAERWQLVRSTGWDGDEPKALSLIRWNVLRGCAERTSDHELGAALVDCVRRAAGFHERRVRKGEGSTSQPPGQINKKEQNVMAGPTPESSIRCNRVSGPFGHLSEGSLFSAARKQVLLCKYPPTRPPVHPPTRVTPCIVPQLPGV